MRWWVVVVVAPLLVSGCFGTHAGEPAGSRCDDDRGRLIDLTCRQAPFARTDADSAEVVYEATMRCCGFASFGTDRIDDDRYEATTGCACSCLRPATEVMTRELAVAGDVGDTVTFEGGDGLTCSVTVGDPTVCAPFEASETRLPRVVFTDQWLVVTSISDVGVGCGCRAETPIDIGGASVDAKVCGCCTDCDCLDPGYETSVRQDPPPVGDYALGLADGTTVDLAVRAPSDCHPIEATGVRVVAPRDDLLDVGPEIWWVEVTGVERLCCAEPVPAVREVVMETGRQLELRSCVEADCDCPSPTETAVTAWFPLTEVPGGEHIVRVGDHVTRFTN